MSRAFMKERDEGPQGLVVVPKRVEPEYARPVDRSIIGYGATVRVSGGRRFNRTFTIVKDADADISSGKVGMTSPLAQAVLDGRTGDRVVWERPAGDVELTIEYIGY